MRFITLWILLLISNFIFAQDAKTIQEINALVEPKFHFDTSQQNYNPCFYDVDTTNNNIIVRAWNRWNASDSEEIGKVFVFKKINSQLSIIDSSASFEVDGRGPRVGVNNDTIFIKHSCHGCTNKSTYKFDKKKQKYLLISLQYSEVITSNNPHYVGASIGIIEEFYDINKQELKFGKRNDYESTIKYKKIIRKPLPNGFNPYLAHFVDLLGEDLRNSDLQ